MKYVLMFTSRPDLNASVDPELGQAVYKKVYEWFQENGDKIADSGAELLGVETATTIKHGDDGPVVVDGPFNEAKEIVGGFSVIDVPDMDAAVAYLRAHDVEVMGEPTASAGASAGQRWLYFRSPWGMQFELVSFPEGKAYEAEADVTLWHPARPSE